MLNHSSEVKATEKYIKVKIVRNLSPRNLRNTREE